MTIRDESFNFMQKSATLVVWHSTYRSRKINKQTRQRQIRELVLAKDIPSQEELSGELKRMGIEVTQATLSRDLHEMRIVRMPTQGGFRYVLPQ